VDGIRALDYTALSSSPMKQSDGFDFGEQPRCERCGTVLRDATGGYRCITCGINVLRTGGTPLPD